MDPLTLLREFNVGGKLGQVKQNGGQVDFGGMYEFPRGTRTAFAPQSGTPCTLDTILFVLKTRQFTQPDYLKAASAEGLECLSFIDRRRLLEILDGKDKLDVSTMGVAELPMAIAALPPDAEPTAKRMRLEDGAGATAVEQRFQRQLRDRNTMLLAGSNKEFKRVVDIANTAHIELSAMLKALANRTAQQGQPHATQQPHKQPPPPDKHRPHTSQPKPAAPGAAKPSSRFDRDNVTGQLKALGGEATMLDMYGMAGSTQPATQATNGSTAPAADGRTATKERPPSSSSQPRPHTSHRSHHSSSQPKPGHPSAQSKLPSSASKPSSSSSSKEDKVPIILVPTAMTAMINMYNARTFLADGRYEPSAAVQAAGGTKPSEVQFERTAGKAIGKGTPYIVTDKPPDKKDEAKWQRVVAVIVSGAKWQFKDWPFKGASEGDMVETFANVAGYYIHFADDKVPDTVANWNVKRLGLARERRHMDAPVVLEMYRHLDQFLIARKSALMF